MTEWSLKDAKEHFAEVVSAARTAPQLVTDANGTAAVVVGPEEYARLTGRPARQKTALWQGRQMTFAELLLAIPKGGPDDLFEREPPKRRDIEL